MPRSRRGLLLAQVHAAGVLGATLDLPGASLLVRHADAPQEDFRGGTPATIVRPTGLPPWPALVFMNGATPDGRTHPIVLRLGAALARTGHLVFIPDLPGIAGGELSPVTLARAVAFTEDVVRSPEVAHGRVGLSGVSIGASLALLTAADRRLATQISAVGGIAPYADLAKVMLLATTGTYRSDAEVFRYPVPPYLAVGLARSLAAMLPPTPAATALCNTLRASEPSASAPSSLPEREFREAGDDAMTLFQLLSNRDPARFDDLYAALPEQIRSTVRELSPINAAPKLATPVEIATAPRDRYFPVAESRSLVAASRCVRLTVTSLLAHATPRLSPRYLAELGRLNGFFVRSLVALR